MQYLIWIGAVVTFIGVIGIVVAAVSVARKRRQGLTHGQMQKAMILNLGAFFVAMVGLMAVMVGVILG